MARARQKHKILDDIGNFMLSKGKLLNQREYTDAQDAPIRYPQILSFFGNWSRMMNSLRVHSPAIYAEIEKAEKAPAPKPKTVEKPKPVKAAPKPVAKPTVKKEEKKDE
jgi:hypothetical protein